jgi:hypothetical protein
MGRTTFSGPVRSLGGFYSQGPNSTIVVNTPTLLLDASYAGKVIRITNPNAVITLPLINATPDPKSAGPGPDPNTQNNLGIPFTFFSEVAAVAAQITTQGLDRIVGSLLIQGATVVGFSPNPATTTKINLNGGTTGGAIGSMFTLQAVAPAKWLLRDANLVGAGAPATPFA